MAVSLPLKESSIEPAVFDLIGQNFQQAIDQFACVRSNHAGIFGSYNTGRIDQCFANFVFSLQSITTVSSAAASSWCADCLIFFENMKQKAYALSSESTHATQRTNWLWAFFKKKKPLKKDDEPYTWSNWGKYELENFCKEAEEISKAFKCFSEYLNRINGDFHAVEHEAEQKAQEAFEEVKREQEAAKRVETQKNHSYDDAVQAKNNANDKATSWKKAAKVTFLIPGVNIVTGVGYAITRSHEKDAIKREEKAHSEYASAKHILENAELKYQKAQDALSDVCSLREKLEKVQKNCERIAGLVSSKAIEFNSMCSRSRGVNAEMIEIGLHQQVAAKEIHFLQKVKRELELVVEVLQRVQSSHVHLSASPQAILISLPSLGVYISGNNN